MHRRIHQHSKGVFCENYGMGGVSLKLVMVFLPFFLRFLSGYPSVSWSFLPYVFCRRWNKKEGNTTLLLRWLGYVRIHIGIPFESSQEVCETALSSYVHSMVLFSINTDADINVAIKLLEF